MVTKTLIKNKKHEVYSIIWNSVLFYAFLCFVLLESTGTYAETLNAFIFSLTNSGRLVPFVSKVKPESKGYAIDRGSIYGPKFGQDLVIYLDAGYRQTSQALLNAAYAVPAEKQVLAGTKNFSPDEVEVFYLDPFP